MLAFCLATCAGRDNRPSPIQKAAACVASPFFALQRAWGGTTGLNTVIGGTPEGLPWRSLLGNGPSLVLRLSGQYESYRRNSGWGGCHGQMLELLCRGLACEGDVRGVACACPRVTTGQAQSRALFLSLLFFPPACAHSLSLFCARCSTRKRREPPSLCVRWPRPSAVRSSPRVPSDTLTDIWCGGMHPLQIASTCLATQNQGHDCHCRERGGWLPVPKMAA